VTFKVTTTPSMAAVRAKYKKAMEDVTVFNPLFVQISIWLDRWNKQNFKTEGGNVGGWKPFAAGGRRRKGGGFDSSAKLLQDTGRLRLSYLPFANNHMGGIGSDLPYAAAHQEGFKSVPARRMVPEKTDVINDIIKIADAHAKKKLRPLK